MRHGRLLANDRAVGGPVLPSTDGALATAHVTKTATGTGLSTVTDDAHPGPPHTAGTRETLLALQKEIRQFAEVRGWQHFHSPKNLVMALAAEVGELTAEFQWLTEEASHLATGDDGSARDRVSDELGDVMIYLLRLCDVLDVDLLTAASEKIHRNSARFPIEQVRGRALRGRDVGKVD